MLEMPALINLIEESEPQYAASWIEHKPELTLVVSFTTSNGDTKLKKYLKDIEWADLVRVEQSLLSHGQLTSTLNHLLRAASARPDILFESGVFYPEGKIHIFTPTPDEIEEYLSSLPFLKTKLEYIDVFYQETLSQFTQGTYSPEVRGGTPLSTCTAGFVFRELSTGRRYISTAGHCDNAQYSVNATNMGAVVPNSEVIYDIDFQAHDVFKASGSGLSNNIITNYGKSNETVREVVNYEYKKDLHGDWVCKYGKVTGVTCGKITSTAFAHIKNAPATYLKIEPSSPRKNFTCQGDSGGPVFKYDPWGNVIAVGLVSSAHRARDCASVNQDSFIATPLDRLAWKGWYVLISKHTPHFYQSVYAPDGTCSRYSADITASGDFINWQPETCSSAPGSGTVTSYTNWVAGNKLHEALWRTTAQGNRKGWTREIPIKPDGKVDWNNLPGWHNCCSGVQVGGQGAFIAGLYFSQNVLDASGGCKTYEDLLDDNGAYALPWEKNGVSCYIGTLPVDVANPANKTTIIAYTNWIFGNILYEALWLNEDGARRGYMRKSTTISELGNLSYPSSSTSSEWELVAEDIDVAGQGAFVLWHE